jgi:hypothetical protein
MGFNTVIEGRMKIQILTLFLIICLTGPAWARLGETEEQLIARYGQETGKESGSIWNKAVPDCIQFQKSGFFIVVWLLNGISSEEYIAKNDYIREGKHDPLTPDETKTLIDANAQGHVWHKVKSGTKWLRDDGAIAVGSETGFDVKSKELMDANTAASKPVPSSLKDF